MRYKRVVLLIPVMALTLSLRDSEVFGQRRGGVAGGAAGGRVVGPYGGSASGFQSRGAVVGPGGRSASGGVSSGSRTTPGGASIDYAGAGRRVSGPGGAAAGGAGAVQVTTRTGQTYTKAGRAGGAVGPGGNAVGGRSSIGVASGPGGTAVGASRGGVALGPGGAVAGGARWGTAAGPYGLAGYSARGVAVGHRTYFVRPGQLPVYGAAVRRNFVHYNVFTPAWYRSYPNAWRAAAWTAATFWAGTTWAALSSSYGYPAQPVVYDYGSTIVYEGDQVIYNGEPVATAEEYTQQAIQIAAQGVEAKPADKEEWTPLGVFGMVQGDEQDANKIFQLAINRDGILRGNYYDALSDTTVPVYGAVDRKSQRAAWTVGDRKDTVYETGIGNLTEPETTMLVHFGKDRTQQWTLVRLEKPQNQE